MINCVKHTVHTYSKEFIEATDERKHLSNMRDI